MTEWGGAAAAALRWLGGQQAADGSFGGQSGPMLDPFEPTVRHETVFFTSLVLICLNGLDFPEAAAGKAAGFLKKQSSPAGSWNYWTRGGEAAGKYPVPDDLDDTACALLALSLHEPVYAGGGRLAALAKLLISNEESPGGPYRTWLVPEALQGQWGDTDTAVNANIGALMSHQGVRLSGLETYLEQMLAAGKLASRYYVGDVPVIYFLSRWYDGPQKAVLKRRTVSRLRQPKKLNSMELAMMITAAGRLGAEPALIAGAKDDLLDRRQGDHWPACALYKEANVAGETYYAGSAALTTALALEALNVPARALPAPVDEAAKPVTFRKLSGLARNLPVGLRKIYLDTARTIDRTDRQGQITAIADLTAAAYGKKLSQESCSHLNLASLNGWTAYSLYDDLYDGDAGAEILGAANHALRQTIIHYAQALPQNVYFQKKVVDTLDKMDAANQWELEHARALIAGDNVQFKLPAYGRLNKLAERSLGHMLSALGAALALGYDDDSPEIAELQKFFRHFIIAKQLNDDAHDWQADLSKGHISPVVGWLLQSYGAQGSISISRDMAELRTHFWENTIQTVGNHIFNHTRAARRSLAACGMTQPAIFEKWLAELEAAARKACDQSAEAQKFIHAYKKS